MSEVNNCGNCRCWIELTILQAGKKDIGQCHRYPPTITPIATVQNGVLSTQVVSAWSTTNRVEACFEHQKKEDWFSESDA